MPRSVGVGIAAALIAFGYLGLFSIGFPFLLTGLLLLVLLAARARPEVVVPTLVWPWVFTVAYVLVAPLGCTTSSVATAGGGLTTAGATRCNAIFLTYAGGETYDPPLLPALVIGLLVATATSLVVHRAMVRRRAPSAPTPSRT